MNVSATAPGEVSLPSVKGALEPEWVRDGSTSTQHAYQEGLGFEEMLTEELTKSLGESGGLGGEGEAQSDTAGEEESAGGLGAGGSQMLSSLLPHALSESVVSGGGLGLAAQMARDIGGASGSGTANGGGASS